MNMNDHYYQQHIKFYAPPCRDLRPFFVQLILQRDVVEDWYTWLSHDGIYQRRRQAIENSPRLFRLLQFRCYVSIISQICPCEMDRFIKVRASNCNETTFSSEVLYQGKCHRLLSELRISCYALAIISFKNFVWGKPDLFYLPCRTSASTCYPSPQDIPPCFGLSRGLCHVARWWRLGECPLGEDVARWYDFLRAVRRSFLQPATICSCFAVH